MKDTTDEKETPAMKDNTTPTTAPGTLLHWAPKLTAQEQEDAYVATMTEAELEAEDIALMEACTKSPSNPEGWYVPEPLDEVARDRRQELAAQLTESLKDFYAFDEAEIQTITALLVMLRGDA